MKLNKNNILWVDCLGGLVVGVIALLICQPLSRWDGLPLGIVIAMGVVNLVYGGYSLFTTTRNPRPLKLVRLLAAANMAWLLVCVVIAVMKSQEMTAFGFVHVIGEGVYVAALGAFEWRWQRCLGE